MAGPRIQEGGLLMGVTPGRSSKKFARLSAAYFATQAALIVAALVYICADNEDYNFLWCLWLAFGCLLCLLIYHISVIYSYEHGQIANKIALVAGLGGLAAFFLMSYDENGSNALKWASGGVFVGALAMINALVGHSTWAAYKRVRLHPAGTVLEFARALQEHIAAPSERSRGLTAVSPSDVQITPVKLLIIPPMDQDGEEDKTEMRQFFCPICMMFYGSIYQSQCCRNYICDPCSGQYIKKGESTVDATSVKTKADCPYCNKARFNMSRVMVGEPVRRYDDSPAVKAKTKPVIDTSASPLKVGDSFEAMKKKMIGFDGKSFSLPYVTPRKNSDKVYPGPGSDFTPEAGALPAAIPEGSPSPSIGIELSPGNLPGTPDAAGDAPPTPTLGAVPGGDPSASGGSRGSGGHTPPAAAPGAELPVRRGPRPLLPVFMSTDMDGPAGEGNAPAPARPLTPSPPGPPESRPDTARPVTSSAINFSEITDDDVAPPGGGLIEQEPSAADLASPRTPSPVREPRAPGGGDDSPPSP